VVKRHGFSGGPRTHGQSDRERAPGAVGRAHSISKGVLPGKRMAGHHGDERVTVKNLEIVKVDAERDLLLVRGAVPGPNDGYVLIHRSAKPKRVRKAGEGKKEKKAAPKKK
jgi:large subunit ribosomal protein L3